MQGLDSSKARNVGGSSFVPDRVTRAEIVAAIRRLIPHNGLRSLDLVSFRKSVAAWKLHSASRFVASIIEE